MTDDLVERVAVAILTAKAGATFGDTQRNMADAAIRIALEEAAQFVQDECHDYDDAHRIAAAIRGMIKENDVQQA
jgi:hypothetical protein